MPTAEQFRHVDVAKDAKPVTLRRVVVRIVTDAAPDLSHIGEVVKHLPVGKTEDELGATRLPGRGWFIPANVEYAQQDFNRYMAYGVDWHSVFISAEAKVVVNGVIQTIQSGGLCGVENDSSEDYIREVCQDEISNLKDILKALGVNEDFPPYEQIKTIEQ